MMPAAPTEECVSIAGAGPVGLSAAARGRHGVRIRATEPYRPLRSGGPLFSEDPTVRVLPARQ
jgi:2-polyprenyl-6-methoxyphenol hydroxylase-like FAD-dependent oxidoreductase